MAGNRLKRKRAKRSAENVAQQAEKRRLLRTVRQSVLYQILLWGCWTSIYLGWLPDDKPYRLIRQAVLTAPIALYIAPLLFCIVSDVIIDWIREWAWCLVVHLWAPSFLSLLLGKERSVNDYVKVYTATTLHTMDNGDRVRICTSEGLRLWVGFAESVFKAYKSNKSWAGTFSSEHLRLTGHQCRINMKPSFSASFDNLLLDLAKLAALLIHHYKGDGQKAESYMKQLYGTLKLPPVGSNSSPVHQERFLNFLCKHLAFKSPRQKKIFILDLFQVVKSMDSAERAAFNHAVGKINVKDWRRVAGQNALLRRTLYFQYNNPNNNICTYGPGPEELLRFVRIMDCGGSEV